MPPTSSLSKRIGNPRCRARHCVRRRAHSLPLVCMAGTGQFLAAPMRADFLLAQEGYSLPMEQEISREPWTRMMMDFYPPATSRRRLTRSVRVADFPRLSDPDVRPHFKSPCILPQTALFKL